MANNRERDCLLRPCTRPMDKNLTKFLFHPSPRSSVVFRNLDVRPRGRSGQMELVRGLVVARGCVPHKMKAARACH